MINLDNSHHFLRKFVFTKTSREVILKWQPRDSAKHDKLCIVWNCIKPSFIDTIPKLGHFWTPFTFTSNISRLWQNAKATLLRIILRLQVRMNHNRAAFNIQDLRKFSQITTYDINHCQVLSSIVFAVHVKNLNPTSNDANWRTWWRYVMRQWLKFMVLILLDYF